MPRSTRVVVIGADAAGMSAAHQALRGARARHRDLEVIVLERTGDTSYSACGIPYWIAGDVPDSDRLVARTAAEHRDLGVDLRMGATATAVDTVKRTVTCQDETRLSFDELVLATGARVIIPEWARDEDGGLVPGVQPVKNLDDGRIWLDLLGSARAARRGIVVGGGYVGVEMAETLMRRGLRTTLLTRSRVMSGFDPDMSGRIETALEEAGVTVRTDTTVASLKRGADGSVSGVVTGDGVLHPADVVVLGTGVRPNSELGAPDLPTGRSGGYLPDRTGRLADGIWAAGDCCESRHRLTGKPEFIPLGTHANKQGRVVGENLSGGDAEFGGVLGTAITRFVTPRRHLELARTGLNGVEASAAGISAQSLVTEGSTASGYMPEATPIATKVLAEPGTRRLIGVQIVGGPNAAKRIDAAAAALWGSMTVDDLAGMDLSYAPPFATTWEAVQIAARRLADRLR
jgi:NADPH-dependent 2,4-dienoyl-CoA reductase/sulfur reductase-like enzyme